MRLEYQNRWLRVVLEIVRPLPVIRRYRVVPAPLDSPTRRFLQRRVLLGLRNPRRELI